MTDEVKVLTDDEVGSIAAKKYLHIGQRDVTVAMDEVRNDIDSLCATVRALRELLNDASETDSRCRVLLKAYDKSSPDGIMPLDEIVETMQSDVNITLREPYAALIEHQGVLVTENTDLREQLAAETERADSNFTAYDRIKTKYSETVNQLAQLTRERDRLQERLNSEQALDIIAPRTLTKEVSDVIEELK